jgi:hypothetical protein
MLAAGNIEQMVEGSRLQEEDAESFESKSTIQSSKKPEASSASFAAVMAKGINSTSLPPTHRWMLEQEIAGLRTYSGKPTPALHACIENSKSDHQVSTYDRIESAC